ncbi:MAG TPA: copper resistance protein CopC [Dehalococcoidia bacterium]|nr:copper resistance protein CopC [Dehalococcoidia bacterium]
MRTKAARAFLCLLALVVAWALGGMPRAHAHANLVRSDPPMNGSVSQAPSEVLLWFSEPVDARFSRIQVVDSSGQRWDNDDAHLHFDDTNLGVTLKGGMPEGTYTVVWSALSAVDGHRTVGSFAFTVGRVATLPAPAAVVAESAGPSGPPKAVRTLATWLELATVIGLVGAVSFYLLVARRATAVLEGGRELAEVRAAALARRWTVALAVACLLASGLVIWMRAWEAAGSAAAWKAAGQLLTDSSFGRALIVRAALLATAGYLGSLLFRPGLQHGAYHWMLLGVAAAVPATVSLSGHANAQDPAALRVALDWAHLTAAGIWVGGLVQMALFLALVPAHGGTRPALLAALVPRFSLLALASVGVIAVTGLTQALLTMGSPGQLASSAYGRALVAKSALFLPLLALGAFNLLLVRPRLESLARTARSALQALRPWEWRLRRAVLGEVCLAVAVVGITAFLVNTAPPASPTASAGQQEPVGVVNKARADDLSLTLLVNPGRAGPNWVQLYITDTNGDPRPVQLVLVRWRYLEQDLGTVEEQMEPLHPPEHYILETQQLSLPGRYQVQVIVRREGLLDSRATFQVDIAQ